MTVLRDSLAGMPSVLVHLVFGVLVTLEAAIVVGVVLPGVSGLLLFGFLAYLGNVGLVAAGCVAALGAALGTTLAYASGRRLSRADGLPDSRIVRRIGEDRWHRTEKLLDRFGGRAVLLGQWVVGIRTLMPRFAAMAGLSYRRFASWSVPVSLLWGSTWVVVGWTAGSAYERVASIAGWVSLVLLVLAAAVLAVVLHRRRVTQAA
ncbi:DedA family protein [Allokutzneria sp. NRRL B-24872]|uniref:DedA family protein n=1 Tax=Allokutzneria sp. NRRL B-24872 TaxID=1137961 RepID=UPI000A38428E|nr:DedA family protein [Allokutzneria sp. NRRL B-24872]